MKSFTYFKADVQSGRIRTLDSQRNEVAILKSSLGFLPQEIILNKKESLLFSRSRCVPFDNSVVH